MTEGLNEQNGITTTQASESQSAREDAIAETSTTTIHRNNAHKSNIQHQQQHRHTSSTHLKPLTNNTNSRKEVHSCHLRKSLHSLPLTHTTQCIKGTTNSSRIHSPSNTIDDRQYTALESPSTVMLVRDGRPTKTRLRNEPSSIHRHSLTQKAEKMMQRATEVKQKEESE